MAKTRQIPLPEQLATTHEGSPPPDPAFFGLGGVSGVPIVEPIKAPGVAGLPKVAPHSTGQFDRMHGQQSPSKLPHLMPDHDDFAPDGDNTANPNSQSPAAILHTEFLMRLRDYRTDQIALANLGDTVIPPDEQLAKMTLGQLRALLTRAGYQSPLPAESS